MAKQTGPCAFSNACTTPGPHRRLEGTNRVYCVPHLRLLALPVSAPVDIAAPTTSLRSERTTVRRSWATYMGIVSG